jgi:hypothetical protein
VEHTFLLQNNSRRDLKIDKVVSSCGCMTAKVNGEVIPPGQRLALPVQVSLKNLRGALLKQLVVKSNDARAPTLVLTARGKVLSRFAPSPERLQFGEVVAGEAAVRVLTVSVDPASPDVGVRSARPVSSEVRVQLKPRRQGGAYEFDVRLAGSLPVGKVRTKIDIETTDAEEPKLVVPVTANVRPRQVER